MSHKTRQNILVRIFLHFSHGQLINVCLIINQATDATFAKLNIQAVQKKLANKHVLLIQIESVRRRRRPILKKLKKIQKVVFLFFV